MSRIKEINKAIGIADINKATDDFFRVVGGKLLFSKHIKIPTYDNPDRNVCCINYYIEFNNRNLFGRGSFSDEVYPRYRKMRADWKKYLKSLGIHLGSDFAVGFVPILDKDNRAGAPYEKEVGRPLGARIVKITAKSPKYYRGMAKKFGVKFALKEGGGMLVGPENGMMIALKAAADSMSQVGRFLDVGAGTGEISAYIIKNYHPYEVVVNDISPVLEQHLVSYLGKARNDLPVKIAINIADCRQLTIPKKIDLASLGVFYGGQPEFLKKKGREISKSLSACGALIIQSSMPDTLFNQHLLMGDCEGIKIWPWYSCGFNLINNFSQVESFFVDNQFMIIAANSRETVVGIINSLPKDVIKYPEYKRRLEKNY